jgi:hypothetical protein
MKQLLGWIVAGVMFAGILFTGVDADRSYVKTTPAQYGWFKVYGAKGEKTTFTTSATSDAVPVWMLAGANTLWLDPDSAVDGSGLDSCLTLGIELYSAASGEWGAYRLGADADTVARSLINVRAVDRDVYFNLPEFNNWQWGDSARFI